MRIFIAGASGLIGVRLAHAASHPQWKHQRPASGPATPAPAAPAVAEDDAPAEQVDQVLVA